MRAAALVVFVAATASASSAFAQAASPAADALFRKGRDAFERGDYHAAYESFVESERLEPAPGTELNLAMTEDKLGLLAAAWQHARGAVDALPPSDDRAVIAQKLFKDLDARVPRVTVRFRGDRPKGTQVHLDALVVDAGAAGVALPIDPGKHSVVVSSPGRDDRRYDFYAVAATTASIDVEIGAPVATNTTTLVTPVAAPITPSFGARGGTIGTALLVAGGASFVATGVMTALVLHDKSVVASDCDARGCQPAAFDAASSGKTFSTVGTITFVAGAALVVSGAALVLHASFAKRPDAASSLTFDPARPLLLRF